MKDWQQVEFAWFFALKEMELGLFGILTSFLIFQEWTFAFVIKEDIFKNLNFNQRQSKNEKWEEPKSQRIYLTGNKMDEERTTSILDMKLEERSIFYSAL